MNWDLIITFFIGGGIGSAVAAYVALRTLKPNIRILTAQEKKVIADAADVASNALIDLINAFQLERAEFTRRIDAQDKKIEAQEEEIEAIKEARRKREIETQAERDELQARIKAELIETRDMRAEYALLKKQIVELKTKHEELEATTQVLTIQNKAAKNVIQKLVQALENNNIEIPALNGDLDKLGESVRGLVVRKP